MKGLLFAGAATLLVITGILFLGAPSSVSAWQYKLHGTGQCVDGFWHVTWTIDNSTEGEGLYITQSDRASVPSPLLISAQSKQVFQENATGDVSLTITGNWLGDRSLRTQSAIVPFNPDCLADRGCKDCTPIVLTPLPQPLVGTDIVEHPTK